MGIISNQVIAPPNQRPETTTQVQLPSRPGPSAQLSQTNIQKKILLRDVEELLKIDDQYALFSRKPL